MRCLGFLQTDKLSSHLVIVTHSLRDFGQVTFLNLSFFTCAVGIIIVPTSQSCGVKEMSKCKALSKCLVYNRRPLNVSIC